MVVTSDFDSEDGGSSPSRRSSRKRRSWLWNIPDEEFLKIANECKTYTEFCNKLNVGGKHHINGKSAAGYGLHVIKIRCKQLQIDHFSKNRKRDNFITPIENLKERGSFKARILRDNLLPYKCNNCDNPGEWDGKPLSLHLHHKNGDPKDHRLDNVEFLCPNCHAQTPNWTSKNRKSRKRD